MRGPGVYEEGRPSWVDLATNDLEAAQHFYTALFGWDYEPVPGGGYYYARNNGHVVAGMARGQNPELSPMWTTYLASADAAATVGRITAAGGTVIVEPMSVGPAGRMAYFADPGGAACGVWEGDQHMGAAVINEPGAFTWAELLAPDTDVVAGFYNAAFGVGAEARDFGPDAPPYTVFTIGDQVVGGTMEPPTPGVAGQWHVYFGSDDVDATAAAAIAALISASSDLRT